MTKKHLSRRTFLRGAAGTAIALPFLEIMGAHSALAAPTGTARRFIAWAQPLGTFGEMFWPTPPGATPYTMYAPGATCPDLGQAKDRCRLKVGRTGETFMDNPSFEPSRILEPLRRHRDDLLVLENIDNARGNHGGYTAMLTGRDIVNEGGRSHATGISVDQEIAKAVGKDTRFPALQLGVRSSDKVHVRHTVSWYGDAQGAAPESNPLEVFKRVFSGVQTEPGEVNYLIEQRRPILDASLEQAADLNKRLGARDRAKVDEYMTSVREIEGRLTAMGAANCEAPPEPADYPGLGVRNFDDVPAVSKLQIDLLVMAMACDLTRVATYQFAYEATNMVHSWLGNNERWHDLSHNSGAGDGWQDRMEQYVRISEYNAQRIAYLIDELKRFDLFDETLFLWINPMNNGQIHNGDSIPIVVAGGGGYLKTGRHVRFERKKHKVNDLHVVLLRAMGIDADAFGDLEYNDTPLTELVA